MLILEELTHARGMKENVLLYRILPQVIAFTYYYHICWLIYVIKPSWSYLVNAHFEVHAEHEYMEFVADTLPQFESEPFTSLFEEDYAFSESVADIFRQIGRLNLGPSA